jgi:hypothetical protein
MVAGEDEHRGILWALRQKTDSAGSLKILLPGSCNQVGSAKRRGEKERIPESVLASSKVDLRDGFGALREIQ